MAAKNLPVPAAKAGAAKTAPSGAKRQTVNKRTAGKVMLIISVCLLPLGLFVLPTTLVFVAGMSPTIVAFAVDRNPDKYLPVIVGSLNLCGVMPVAFELWQGGSSLDHALALLADPFNLAIMFGAAAIGWVINMIVPPMVADVMIWRNQAEIERWQARQQALIEEWSVKVTGAADAVERET